MHPVRIMVRIAASDKNGHTWWEGTGPGCFAARKVSASTDDPTRRAAQEVLMDFPQLTMTLPDGREESIMKRTTLVRAWSTALRPTSTSVRHAKLQFH